MTVQSILPRRLELNVEYARKLGWRKISWSVSRGRTVIVGIPPREEVTAVVPDFTGDPGVYFDLAKAHNLLVTRPWDRWVVINFDALGEEPYLASFPAETMVDDPGPRIVELALAAIDKSR